MPGDIKIEIDIAETEFELLLRLLRNEPRNTMQLAKDAQVGYFWLRKLREGKSRNPAYIPTRRLLLHLAANAR